MARVVGDLARLAKVRDVLPLASTWVIRWRIAGEVWEQRVLWRTASAWSSSPESSDASYWSARLGLFVLAVGLPRR